MLSSEIEGGKAGTNLLGGDVDNERCKAMMIFGCDGTQFNIKFGFV